MKSDQRRSLSGGGAGSSPAFSAADILRAHSMGVALDDALLVEVTLSPGDVLSVRRNDGTYAGVGTVDADQMRHADTVLATIRSERLARMAAEKRVTALDAALTDALTLLADLQIYEGLWARRVSKWKLLALSSVPIVAVQTMVILWLVVSR